MERKFVMIFLALIYVAFINLGLPDSLLGSSWTIMNVDFRVPAGNAGFISMIVSSGTIISSLLSHQLIRRFGTGKVTVVSVAMTAVALLGFSLSPSFLWLLVCAIPLGLGAGAVDSGLNEFVAEHYEAKHMNWLHCSWGIGAMIGPVLISTLTHQGHSWRSGYSTISLIQFALVVLLLFSLPMWKKYESPSAEHTGKVQDSKVKHRLFTLQRTKGTIFAMITFFLYTSIEASMILWGASYLVKIKNVLPESAAGWVSLFFLGITAGRMLSGFVSMKLSNEALIHIGAILIIVGVVLMLLPLPTMLTICALIIIGLGLAPIYPSMLHQTPVYFGKQNAQETMGLQMAFAYTGSTLMPPLFGQLFAHVSFSLMPYVLLACSVGLLACTAHLAAISKKKSLVQECSCRANQVGEKLNYYYKGDVSMKTLVLVAHPNLEKSVINRRWVEELKKYPEQYTVHELNTIYPDGKIDVEKEQKLVESHSNLVLQFPIFWFSCPPMMKKWLDDVLTHGWAYGSNSGNKLTGRKVALAVTAGIKEEDYRETGRYRHTLAQLLTPFETIFSYTDADYRSFFAFYGAEYEPSAEVIEKSAQDYLNFLNQL